jgi:hypothetical protein
LTLIYQPEYARQDVFIWLMVAAGIGYVGSFLGYGMTAVRYFRVQLPLFAMVACVTVLIWVLVDSDKWFGGGCLDVIKRCGGAIGLIFFGYQPCASR